MEPEPRYTPNHDDIAARVLDGEAIMINLAKGTYYSLDGVGGRIWELLEEGKGAAEMADTISLEFDVTAERARADIDRILGELQAEDALRTVLVGAPPSKTTPRTRCAEKRPYREPKLTVYRDMADLLALEPPTPGTDQDDLWEGFEAKAGG
ncbi:MAG: PqqD family protein [Candidatus Bipolaricaulis sp.]|nr:PqqD family protein [Candidatus Bipolaricaulis sp.]